MWHGTRKPCWTVLGFLARQMLEFCFRKKKKARKAFFNLSTPKAKLKTDINTERLRQTQLCDIGKPEYFSLKYSKTTNCRKSSSKVIKARNKWKLSLDSRNL